MQDGPKLDAEAVEASAGVFVRNGTVKKMMITIKLRQTTTVVDGKITSVRLEKA